MTRSSAAHEPSMDEILASIRRIIESGDERPAPVVRPRLEGAARVERLEPSGEADAKIVARLTPEASWPQADDPQNPVSDAFESVDEAELAARLREELSDEDAIDWAALNAALAEEVRGPAASLPDDGGEPFRPDEDEASIEPGPEEGAAPDLSFVAANSDSPRMQEFRSAVLEDLHSGGMAESGPLTSGRTGELVGASFDALADAIREGQMRSMEEMAQDLLRPMLQDWLDDNLPKLVERLVREEIERVARGPRR